MVERELSEIDLRIVRRSYGSIRDILKRNLNLQRDMREDLEVALARLGKFNSFYVGFYNPNLKSRYFHG